MTSNMDSWEYANAYVADLLIERFDSRERILNEEFVPKYVWAEIEEFLQVKNPRILHPFCNFGLETLSFSKYAFESIEGLDFSTNAIDSAKQIARNANIDANFTRADCTTHLSQTGDLFDLIFLSLGSLWWVSNLQDFFTLLRKHLVVGGIIVLWEFHPLVHCIDDGQRIFRDYPKFTDRYDHISGIENYQLQKYGLVHAHEVDFRNPAPVTDYRHSLAAIFDGIISIGTLELCAFKELYDTHKERYFDWQTQNEVNYWVCDSRFFRLPLAMLATIQRTH